MAFDNSEMIEQMMSFSSRGLHDIRISNLNAEPVIEKWLPEKETGDIFCREFKGRMDHRWKIASYSYLTRALPDEAEWDEQTDLVLARDVFSEKKMTDSMLFFPPGATSGILLHEILEKVDFHSAGGVEARELVRATLEKFNFAGSWQSVILKMIEELAQARLEPPDAIGFCLAEVDSPRCLREMEFYFPLREIVPARLLALLESSPPRGKSEDQTKLNFPPVHGFLKGFIDLVFEHDGRYYLADWKSNRLGDDHNDYGPMLLEREIVRSYYDVQYLIYTVALDRYLRQRLPGYTYERHFGGVYYFFLRGVNAGAGKQNGIYFHRPDEHLIGELIETLVAGA